MGNIINKQIKWVLCPGSRVSPRHAERYNQIYKTWHQLWAETLKSSGINEPLRSESFTRQDFIGCLFLENECLGLCSFRWANSYEISFGQDSCFNIWTPQNLEALQSRGPQVIVCGNFCLSPKFRSEALGFSCKDLLMGMVVETFMASRADSLAGTVRVNRKMNDLTVRWGAEILSAGVRSEYGEEFADLIAFYRDQVQQARLPEIHSWAKQLWLDRVILPQVSIPIEKFDEPESRLAISVA